MAVKSMNIKPNDKGQDEVVNPGKIKTDAEFPEVGKNLKTESEKGVVPDGKGGATEAK